MMLELPQRRQLEQSLPQQLWSSAGFGEGVSSEGASSEGVSEGFGLCSGCVCDWVSQQFVALVDICAVLVAEQHESPADALVLKTGTTTAKIAQRAAISRVGLTRFRSGIALIVTAKGA